MNLANDHAYDFGTSGLEQTISALDTAGLLHTGRPGEVTIQRVGQIRVALVGFSSYPWTASVTDIARAKRLVRQASRRADIVIVSMHAGAEGPTASTSARERSATAARTAATSSGSPTRPSTRAPTSSSATARACSAGWSGTEAA